MEAQSTSPSASGLADSLSALARAFTEAIGRPDVAAAHRLIAEAAGAGFSPGRLYVEVVRPALAELQGEEGDSRSRLAGGIAAAVIGELVVSLPLAERRGSGRVAILTCRDAGIESVDGDIALGFLAAGGWNVDRRDRTVDDALAELTRVSGIELAVAVISGLEDALRLAPACTALRRLADPPVILLCDFSPRPAWMTASSVLGADAVVSDPEELMRQAAVRAPDGGSRRWGVRLTRHGRTLTLAPTGTLNVCNIERLSDVVHSRAGSFDELVLDLRDLAGQDPDAMAALATVAARFPLGPDAVSVIPAT